MAARETIGFAVDAGSVHSVLMGNTKSPGFGRGDWRHGLPLAGSSNGCKLPNLKAPGRSLTCFDRCRTLTECRRDIPEMAECSVAIQRGTLKWSRRLAAWFSSHGMCGEGRDRPAAALARPIAFRHRKDGGLGAVKARLDVVVAADRHAGQETPNWPGSPLAAHVSRPMPRATHLDTILGFS